MMCGARCAGGGRTEGLTQIDRELFRRSHERAVFGHSRKWIDMINLLIGVTLLVDLALPSGDRDNRGASEIGVL